MQGQGHGAFELPTTSEAVHAGGDDRSPLAGLSGFSLLIYFLTFAFENSPALFSGQRSYEATKPGLLSCL